MRSAAVLIAVLAAAPGLAAAQVVSARPDKVAVVLYQERPPYASEWDAPDVDGFEGPGLATVSEVRTLDLPAGRSRVSFRDVAEGMVPQTAAIEGLEGRLIERNFDFDLLSPGMLVQRVVGGTARLVRTNRKTGEVSEIPVVVRSGPEGIVLQHPDGTAEALGCSGEPERLVFDRVPPGLSATPTLSADVEAPRAGRYVVRLSYLATGLRWKADYVARVNPARGVLDLQGWLTLSNRGATTFGDAPIQVIAGELARAGEDDAPSANAAQLGRGRCWPIEPRPLPEGSTVNRVALSVSAVAQMSDLQEVIVTGSRVTVSNIGDYKLYSLNEPTTLAANQTKQVAFLAQAAVPYRRVYAYLARPAYPPESDDPEAPNAHVDAVPIMLRLQNKAEEGLGKPLPNGVVAVLEPGPDGGLSLAGHPRIQDTPVGLPLDLELGGSSAVTVTATQGEYSRFRRAGRDFLRSAVTLTVRNATGRATPVEIRLDQSLFKMLGESRPHVLDGGFALWTLQVPAEGQTTLTYRIERR